MAAHGPVQLGGRAFNHDQDPEVEAEYDRLRDLARQEHSKAQSCFDRAHQAYSSGNGAEASSLSSVGKQHQASAAAYNKQASEYIFTSNNSPAHNIPADTIDLHGQFVDEAVTILETRIRTAKAQNQTHLHVIVGKGNHSPGHIQKIKPAVERICQEEGLSFRTEENQGRIYVDLTGGNAQMPGEQQWAGAYSGGGYGQQGGYPQQQQQGQGYQYQPQAQPQAQYQPQYAQQQQQQYSGGQAQQQGQTQQQMEIERMEQSAIKACLRACCTVM